MLRRVSVLAAALSVAFAPGLAAQDLSEACAAVTQSEVGYWAAFDLVDTPSPDVSSLRFAMVERSESDGTSDTWYEFSAETDQGQVVVQLNVPGWPFETDQVAGAIVKMAGQPAMRLPSEMLGMMQQQMGDNPMADFAERCATSEVLGREDVEVPAGSFSTLRIRSYDNGSEAWISSDVAFGIVKGTVPDGGTLILTGYGDDATSSITEEPQMMPGMGGMNQ